MTLTIDDIVTHYILSSHPKNKAIVDIKDKNTGDLRYIKIRHRLSKFYAVSLVDPVTFEVWAETQAKSATAKTKPIVLHLEEDTPVELRDTSRLGFEWTFSWEGEKYRWVRESRMSNTLECKAIRKSGDICVAQYLPRMLKDEYFGIFSLLGYNMLRCKLSKSRELELLILMSLMTLLDKSNDGGWKRDLVSKGVQDTIPDAVDPIPDKKKSKKELLNDQKLQLLFEKDMKRSQKQISSDQKQFMSADNSPAHTPKTSPLPTPSSSSNLIRSPRLSRQKSASALTFENNNDVSTQNIEGRLSQMFINLKQSNSTVDSSPLLAKQVPERHHQLRSQNQFQLEPDYNYNHQLSLPIGYDYQTPPSVTSIRWNPEPSQQASYYVSRSNSHGRRRLVDDPYQYPQVNNRYSSSEYYMPSYQHYY